MKELYGKELEVQLKSKLARNQAELARMQDDIDQGRVESRDYFFSQAVSAAEVSSTLEMLNILKTDGMGEFEAVEHIEGK